MVGSQLQSVSGSSSTFVGGKSGKFILWLTEHFKGGPADRLLCSCSVQKVVPGGLKIAYCAEKWQKEEAVCCVVIKSMK